MAKRKNKSKGMKIQPAITNLVYSWRPSTTDQGQNTSTNQYIDVFRDLSRVNRRHYHQNRMLAIEGITFVYPDAANSGTYPIFTLKAHSAGNSWVVQNAHVKGEALWHQMNELVLEDNPSIQGKWSGYKVRMDDHQATDNANVLDPLDGDNAAYLAGEWEYSTYVMPQHVVDPVTGQPLPAEERTAHLVGADFGTRIGLVQAYSDSRATVQPIDPSVPAGMSTSFFNLLTDSGSQEPELADVIEDANDEPPYDQDAYPGGSTNADCTVLHCQASVSSFSPDGRLPGMLLPCGLLHLNGTIIDDDVMVIVHVAPGMYKGVAAIPMGQ